MLPNHPVVYVNWHDALHYCDWLTALPTGVARDARTSGASCCAMPAGVSRCRVRRNGRRRRGVPMGGVIRGETTPDPDRANYGETGIGNTSTVGCFPGGVSPYGVEEMSGNVWEWTRSLWRAEPDKPIFRYPIMIRHDGGNNCKRR